MLYYDMLDEIADHSVPNDLHPLFHVKPREVWIESVSMLIEKKLIPSDYESLCNLASNWETLLAIRFSSLN